MRDIGEWGLSPLDPMLVLPAGRNTWITLEGNRRLAALKILENPRIVDDPKAAAACARIAKEARQKITLVQCAVVKSREEADHWLRLRHTGENNGAGVVPWSAEQQHRFAGRAGTDVHAGITFADAVQAAYGRDEQIAEDLAKVRAEKITTLGRLVRDPDFRGALGILMDKDGIRWHYPADDLAPAIRKLMADLSAALTVSSIKSKDQRRTYIQGLPKPDPSSYQHQAGLLKASKATTGKAGPRKQKQQPPSKHLLGGLELSNVSARTQALASELRQLDIERFPNVCGVLMRVVVELSIEDFLVGKKIKVALELKDKIRRALHEIDPTDKDQRFHAVRVGLSDGTSLMAARTMHSFVHNQHYHPTPTELRQLSSNYGPFIQALDSALP